MRPDPVFCARAFLYLRVFADRLDARRAPLAQEIRALVLAKEHDYAAIKLKQLSDALDDDFDAAARAARLLQREHQSIDDRFAFGLGLYGGKETRVGYGLGGLRGENLQELHVALA